MRALALLALLLALAATPALGQEKRITVDLYGPRSERKGYMIIEPGSGRTDIYDAKSRRTGYGKIGEDGRVELFDAKSRRVGEARPSR
jgi:hypothetical protein